MDGVVVLSCVMGANGRHSGAWLCDRGASGRHRGGGWLCYRGASGGIVVLGCVTGVRVAV